MQGDMLIPRRTLIGDAVPEIEVDKVLIGYSGICCLVLEAGYGILIDMEGNLLLGFSHRLIPYAVAEMVTALHVLTIIIVVAVSAPCRIQLP